MCIKKHQSHTNLLAAFENDSWLKNNVWDVSSVNKKLLDRIALNSECLEYKPFKNNQECIKNIVIDFKVENLVFMIGFFSGSQVVGIFIRKMPNI